MLILTTIIIHQIKAVRIIIKVTLCHQMILIKKKQKYLLNFSLIATLRARNVSLVKNMATVQSVGKEAWIKYLIIFVFALIIKRLKMGTAVFYSIHFLLSN